MAMKFHSVCLIALPLSFLVLNMNEVSKIAIVTGAGSGIGAAITNALANQNYLVFAVGRREKALQETAARNPQFIRVRPLDVGDRQAVDKFGCVHCRGVWTSGLFGELGRNQHGQPDLLQVCRSMIGIDPACQHHRRVQLHSIGDPQMRKQGGGTIVNISSVAGKRAYAWRSCVQRIQVCDDRSWATIGEKRKDTAFVLRTSFR